MDNPLTPNKIQRLINLAEDKSFNIPRRLLCDEGLLKLNAHQGMSKSSTPPATESSLGILDLDRVEGFGESALGNASLSKSTAFNPGEMTGRSTGTEELTSKGFGSRGFEEVGRHSLAIDSITSQMDKQTHEIQDVMRHSIATNYSFHSKRDLTADEMSLVMREAPIPMAPGTQVHIADGTTTINNSDMSVGAYFQNRCPDFIKMLGKTDSPDRSVHDLHRPSITEVSTNATLEYAGKESNIYKVDQSLDSVPVKQPRSLAEKVPDNRIINNLNSTIDRPKNCNIVAGLQDLPSGRLTAKIENPTLLKDPFKHPSSGAASNLHPVTTSHKSFMSSSKPTDVLLRNLQTSMRLITDDTEGSVENSLSLSKIADYLGKQSNVSVTDMLQLNHMKKQHRKHPLTELHMNTQITKPQDVQVVSLKDSKKTISSSSANSFNTVISMDKLRIQQENKNEVPAVIITQDTAEGQEIEDIKVRQRSTRSKSPSSKSQSTLSTVHENFASFKSEESPLQSSRGEANASCAPSPEVVYKELDNSIDWNEVLKQKRLKQEGLPKEKWAEIETTSANGFVGVSCPVTITVTTLSDSWLTAKFQFDELPNNGRDLTVELPRLPLLLSPGKSEQFTLFLTSSTELTTHLPFTMFLKDASVDRDIEQKSTVEVNIKMPEIQAMSSDGINKVTFPPVAEKTCIAKSFILMSDSPVDLQLDLSITEGESMFAIKNAQEVKRSDVNKVLMDRQGSTEEQAAKGKHKVMNKQLCRLTSGNAIKVTVTFNAPKLTAIQIEDKIASFTGILNVNLMGVDTVLRKVELISIVGVLNLDVSIPGEKAKLHLTGESKNVLVQNTGTILGIWTARFRHSSGQSVPFVVNPVKFDLRPGFSKQIAIAYNGPEDGFCETTLVFEEIYTGTKTTIDVVGGSDKPKSFPIKCSSNTLSWVRSGRKELSLKNSCNKKVHVKCQVLGEGFSIDLPGVESRGTYLLPFGPYECRTLPVMFSPGTCLPHTAMLHLVFDKNSDVSRKVRLFGCATSESVRWHELVTYGNTALVRAVTRAPVDLKLYNKSAAPAFICARVHFNLQYMCVSESARLVGRRCVVAARTKHTVSMLVDWARVERRARDSPAAAALATLTVLTGAEHTRRRILRVIRKDNGELDLSLLPEHLKVLADLFEGEDSSMDNQLADFHETKASLNELIGGLQELTAQIDLPQDFADENTIIIADDTMIEHHTLCD